MARSLIINDEENVHPVFGGTLERCGYEMVLAAAANQDFDTLNAVDHRTPNGLCEIAELLNSARRLLKRDLQSDG